MKYLLLVAVVLVVWWLLRARPARPRPPTAPPPPADPQAMVRCRHCGLHLPRDEAVAGDDGPYCSDAHRLAGGGPR
ncbi:MAG TPA: PP0621 family protein [Methylibium sp.]|nr:PP0621 family protein [Methylibium sp.]